MDANIVVATPEKLDFALRQDPLVLNDVGLIVFDEGHMIGLGSREIRYEALIQRLLRRADAGERRILALALGVGTHHGALPRPFQGAIEDLLEKKHLPIVVASPTLAQGVDLSCSVLIFRSLTRFDANAGVHKPISATEFANVVGRAGRAYVNLDGIVVLPCFKKARQKHAQFEKLIEESKNQQLVSGFARLVAELAKLLAARLSVPIEQLLEYVLNQGDLWTDERLSAADDVEDDEDPTAHTLDEYVLDLDVAILSLIDQQSDNVRQFSFWADEKRAMPSDFIACALFAGIQEKDVAYLNDVEIANANGLRIVFKGNQLTQVHADVWQGIMHLARRQNEGATVRFKARPFR